jgi:tRNA/tmRNA/rRNA uracil-C5-methylase (TrmA/RlmC/RlmD family)
MMMPTTEAWQATTPTINFKQRKRLSRSAYDRRKPSYQAVSTSLATSRRARVAAFDCIKDGVFIDLTCGKGSFFNHLPNEEKICGCEIEPDSYAIARSMFPEANLTLGDIRSTIPGCSFI